MRYISHVSHHPATENQNRLQWQSKLLVGIIIPLALFTSYCTTNSFRAAWSHPQPAYFFLPIFCVIFAAFVALTRSATLPAAITGGLFCYNLTTITQSKISLPLQSCLPALVVLFLLTFAATRWRRNQKLSLGLAESSHGRATSQVVANLGVACGGILILLAFIVSLLSSSLFQTHFIQMLVSIMLSSHLAALAEATADTLSSEIGQAIGGRTWMLTTFRPVAVGIDGGVSLLGTLAGLTGAALVTLTGALAMHLPPRTALLAFVGAAFGLFFDSLLGATLERRGLINNDVVNFLSTLAAALFAAALLML